MMQPRPHPKFLSATVLHDGRVLLELLADWRTSLGVAESRVDAGERTTDILIGWATNARREGWRGMRETNDARAETGTMRPSTAAARPRAAWVNELSIADAA